MGKTKEQKAITLIALIITIVVLLILAAVAINAVTGDGIIQHATNAKTQYENAQTKEQGILSYYESYLETEGKTGEWKQNGNKIVRTNEDGTADVLLVGDYVEYNELSNGEKTYTIYETLSGLKTGTDAVLKTENLEWRVLGVNNGQIELISSAPTSTQLGLRARKGYKNAVSILNDTCNTLYGQGEYAGKARSLDFTDIEKILGQKTEEQKKELWNNYGTKAYYKYDTTTSKVKASKDNVNWIDIGLSYLYFIDDWQIDSNYEGTYEYDEYNYWCYTGEVGNEIKDETMAELIYYNKNNEFYTTYWLATTTSFYVNEWSDDWPLLPCWACRTVNSGLASWNYETLYSGKTAVENFCSLRPVVVLNSDVDFEKDVNNGRWKISENN